LSTDFFRNKFIGYIFRRGNVKNAPQVDFFKMKIYKVNAETLLNTISIIFQIRTKFVPAIMPSILFVVPHRLNRAPSQRFRFEQYFNMWQQAGYQCTLAPLISEKTDSIFIIQAACFERDCCLLILF
jgi:hypothetical protein